jgi:hypothetical protein
MLRKELCHSYLSGMGLSLYYLDVRAMMVIISCFRYGLRPKKILMESSLPLALWFLGLIIGQKKMSLST